MTNYLCIICNYHYIISKYIFWALSSKGLLASKVNATNRLASRDKTARYLIGKENVRRLLNKLLSVDPADAHVHVNTSFSSMALDSVAHFLKSKHIKDSKERYLLTKTQSANFRFIFKFIFYQATKQHLNNN